MATKSLQRRVNSINYHAKKNPLDPQLIEAYTIALDVALYTEKDIAYGLEMGRKAKEYLFNLIKLKSKGGSFGWLEELSQRTKEEYPIINAYYEILRLEAPLLLDSFKLYIERDRPRKDRFYEPRRKTLIQLTNAVQRLEDDELDMLFLHMPPRTGKLLADDTPVFTADGWKNHGDLVVGDKVIGSDGKYTEVVKVHPKDVADYRVTLANGESFRCHGNHEWTGYLFDNGNMEYVTMETKAIPNGKFFLQQISENALRVMIDTIEPCEPVPGNCITVANADGLYAVGKTMQLTHNSGDITMDTCWHCARDMEHSNLYVTYKEGLGGAFLQGCNEIFTDPTYRFADVFPEAKIVDTDAKNNKMDLGRKKKYKTLSGKGLESGLNGEYDAYGWMIVDDPLEGVQDVLSEDVLRRKQTIFDNNVLSRKKEKCKLICEGTLWSTKDLFSNYLDFVESSPEMADTRYDVIKIPALDPDTDESNFDYEYGVGFTTKYYRGVRAKFENNDDMVGWQCQYMQQPIEREGAVFNPEHMNYYSDLPGVEPLKVIAHCDVALGGGDYLTFPVAYYYENNDGTLTGYVEDVVFDNSEKTITQPQVVAKIKQHHIKWAHFESNQGGDGYKDEVAKRLADDKTYTDICNFTADWAQTTLRKDQRIWDNAQDIRNLYFKDPNHRDKQYRKFMQNLFSFTMGKNKHKHDDAADALAGLVKFEREGSGITTAVIMKSPI